MKRFLIWLLDLDSLVDRVERLEEDYKSLSKKNQGLTKTISSLQSKVDSGERKIKQLKNR